MALTLLRFVPQICWRGRNAGAPFSLFVPILRAKRVYSAWLGERNGECVGAHWEVPTDTSNRI